MLLRRHPRLRTRIVVAAATSVVIAVVILGGAVQVLLSRHLYAELDSTLRDRAAVIVQVSASAPALLRSPSVLEQSAGPRPLAVEVLDRHGRIVARSLTLGGQTLQVGGLVAAAIEHGRSGYANATLGNDRMRVYAAPLPALGGPASGGAVIVAGTTDDVSSTLSESRLLIVLSAIAAALLVVPIAYVLAGRALGPLRELAAAAEVIEASGDPAMRLPATGGERSPDELARLGDTLNRMLSALERARDRERRFVADASHELRNPLTALRGNAAYLARNGADRAALRDLQEDADRLARLVDELLALAREESAPLPDEPVRLDRLAEPFGDEQVEVHAGDPGWVHGDAAAIERALENLVENARRYGPQGAPIDVSVTRSGGLVELAVTDRGAGIPAEIADRATQRFWRGEGAPASEGSGLGLALVRATAERHGGRLVIDGSRFAIELPALRPLSDAGATTGGHDFDRGTP